MHRWRQIGVSLRIERGSYKSKAFIELLCIRMKGARHKNNVERLSMAQIIEGIKRRLPVSLTEFSIHTLNDQAGFRLSLNTAGHLGTQRAMGQEMRGKNVDHRSNGWQVKDLGYHSSPQTKGVIQDIIGSPGARFTRICGRTRPVSSKMVRGSVVGKAIWRPSASLIRHGVPGGIKVE